MPRSKPKPDVRELLTVFDTNALWTQNPGDLINADMRTLVTSNSAHADLKISWHLPEPRGARTSLPNERKGDSTSKEL
jgi:hypothetical protein